MLLKIGLRWKIYFFIAAPLTLGNFLAVLHPDSPLYAYYHILMTFDADFTLFWGLNIASGLLNFISLIPFFLYVFQIKFLKLRIWQWLFALRVIFDLTGHSYEVSFFKSLFYSNPQYALSMILLSLAVYIPSYIACYKYSFREETLF